MGCPAGNFAKERGFFAHDSPTLLGTRPLIGPGTAYSTRDCRLDLGLLTRPGTADSTWDC